MSEQKVYTSADYLAGCQQIMTQITQANEKYGEQTATYAESLDKAEREYQAAKKAMEAAKKLKDSLKKNREELFNNLIKNTSTKSQTLEGYKSEYARLYAHEAACKAQAEITNNLAIFRIN